MQIDENSWIREFPGAITVCDREGIIREMNELAIRLFSKYGGRELIGKSVFNCHPEAARAKQDHLLKTGQRNVYSMEHNGLKWLLYQSPWYNKGEYAGFVELALQVPSEIPHHLRS
jgi:PAS domain S-box-containing protein